MHWHLEWTSSGSTRGNSGVPFPHGRLAQRVPAKDALQGATDRLPRHRQRRQQQLLPQCLAVEWICGTHGELMQTGSATRKHPICKYTHMHPRRPTHAHTRAHTVIDYCRGEEPHQTDIKNERDTTQKISNSIATPTGSTPRTSKLYPPHWGGPWKCRARSCSSGLLTKPAFPAAGSPAQAARATLPQSTQLCHRCLGHLCPRPPPRADRSGDMC